MDPSKQKKRQNIKVIVSEAIMVLAVIATVAVLAFIVSGYWINSDFEVERQGMLQISSVPTGATIDIDGETSSWLQRTNTSKVLPSGEHTVTLTKDNYDSWSKTINIKEGLLYRLHYPRLFLKERTPEKMLSLSGTTSAVISSNHNSLLLINNTTSWTFINLDADKLEPKPVDISKVFLNVNLTSKADAGLFTGEIISADWDYDAAHVLFEVKGEAGTEWVLVDVKDATKSINLTREFSSDFSEVQILDNSSSNLIAIQNGNLQKIDIPSRQLSAVLVQNVLNFDHYENEVVFTALDNKTSDETDTTYYIGFLKIGSSEVTKLTKATASTQVVISKFYDDKYITTLSGNLAKVYQKEGFEEFANYELGFEPAQIEVGHNGEFITMFTNNHIATLDMEAGLVRDWATDGTIFDWIDNDMIYSVSDGELIVYDFDGFNRRSLAKNVSAHFPAGITDNKWLYYISDDYLMRELITS